MIPPTSALPFRPRPAAAGATARRPPWTQRCARDLACRLAQVLRRVLGDDERAWVSTRLWVPVAGGLRLPDVAVTFGDPPADGVMNRPPCLVLEHHAVPCPVAPDAWLRAGVGEVWTVEDGQVVVRRSHATTPLLRRVPERDQRGQQVRLPLPRTSARVAVAALTAVATR